MCKELKFDTVSKELFATVNVIYGAGDNGKRLYNKCMENHIPIYAFYDDDPVRWNETYCGCKILSKSEFELLDKHDVIIIIGSLYLKQISEKLICQGFDNIYAAYEMMLNRENYVYHFENYSNDREYINNIDILAAYFHYDLLSQKFYQLLKETAITGRAQNTISDIFCSEQQYFLDVLKDKINDLNFVDAGAYTGDTIRTMIKIGICPKAVYCFEADRSNYSKLKDYVDELSEKENIVCENYALWNECVKVEITGSKFNSQVNEITSKSTNQINAITLDEYFKNIQVGFVKMDIEGAEYQALIGGEHIIERDRPILAISIYHSMEDRVEIPLYLIRKLKNYYFIIRHHSYTYSETILYGIPKEKLGD